MSLFNTPTQYTGDVSQVNRQNEASANETTNFVMGLIQSDNQLRSTHAKTLYQLGPLIGKYNQLRELREKKLKSEAESDMYFDINKPLPYGVSVGDQKFESTENAFNALRGSELTGVVNETAPGGNVEIAQVLADSNGGYRQTRKKLIHASKVYSEMAVLGGQHVKLTRDNGTSFTRDDAQTLTEHLAATRAIRNIYLASLMDGTTTSQRRKYLYEKLKEVEKHHTDQWISAKRESIKEGVKLESLEELSTSVNEWVFPTEDELDIKNPFTEFIKTHRGVYGGTDENGQALGDLGTAKREIYGKFIDLAEEGLVDIDTVENIGESWFTAEDGSRQQVKNYFKTQHNKLTDAAIRATTDKLTLRNQQVKNEILEWGLDLEKQWTNQEGPVTNQQLDDAITDFRAQQGWRGRQFPEIISKWYTMEDEDDDEIKKRIIAKAANLIPVDLSELGGISDPATKLSLIQQLKISNLSAMTKVDSDRMEGELKDLIGTKLNETDANTDTKSAPYRNSLRQATRDYKSIFAATLTENPGNKELAHRKATDFVRPKIKDGDYETLEPIAVDNALSNNVSKTFRIIAAKPESINQQVLPAVTKTDLEIGLRAINNQAEIPPIFYEIAKKTKTTDGGHLDAFDVLWQQVNAGLRAEGAPELKNPKKPVVLQQMRDALKPSEIKAVNNSQAGLNQVIKTNTDNLEWLLTAVKDDTAMVNGAYDFILSPDGGDAHLDKPLTEHTVQEVMGLIQQGHGNLTAYGMTPRQFVDAFQASGLPINAVLDEQTQDTLALYTAIVNIKHRNDLTGFYGSNEIADLTDQDRNRISSIVGTVPSDWNKIENLVSSQLY